MVEQVATVETAKLLPLLVVEEPEEQGDTGEFYF
jgi:hypothetical protein